MSLKIYGAKGISSVSQPFLLQRNPT